MPAWGGVLGGALTEAANAYLEAILPDSPTNVERRRKQLENQYLESQIERNKAYSEYEKRRYAGGPGGGKERLFRGPNGWYRYDFETDTNKLVIPFPEKPAKAEDQEKWLFDRLMESILQKPKSEFTLEDFARPEIQFLYDMRNKKSGIIGVPGEPPYPRSDVYGLPRSGQPAPGGAPAPTTPAPATPRQPVTGTPGAVAPAPRATPRQTPTVVDVKPDPRWLTHYITRFKTLPKEEAQKQLEQVRSAPGVQAPMLAAMAEAYRQVYGEVPPGWHAQEGTTSQTPGETAVPPAAGTPPPAAAEKSGAVAPPLRTRTQEFKEEDEKRKQDAAARAEEDERRKKARELAPLPTTEQATMTNRLFVDRQVDSAYYPELSPPQKQVVDDAIARPKREKEDRDKQIYLGRLRKEHIDALKKAEPYIHELRAIDTTRDLTNLIVPLLRSGTIGIGGKGQTLGNVLAQWLPGYKTAYQREAEKQLKAEGAAIDKAAVDARVAALVEGNVPEIKHTGMFYPTASKLEVLSSILAYVHALTIKRSATGPSGRSGITVQDLKEAHEWFDPRLWTTSPEIMMARLEGLQKYIQIARPHVRDMIRSFYIDPDKPGHPLLPYEMPQEGAPSALTPEQMEQLQKGP